MKLNSDSSGWISWSRLYRVNTPRVLERAKSEARADLWRTRDWKGWVATPKLLRYPPSVFKTLLTCNKGRNCGYMSGTWSDSERQTRVQSLGVGYHVEWFGLKNVAASTRTIAQGQHLVRNRDRVVLWQTLHGLGVRPRLNGITHASMPAVHLFTFPNLFKFVMWTPQSSLEPKFHLRNSIETTLRSFYESPWQWFQPLHEQNRSNRGRLACTKELCAHGSLVRQRMDHMGRTSENSVAGRRHLKTNPPISLLSLSRFCRWAPNFFFCPWANLIAGRQTSYRCKPCLHPKFPWNPGSQAQIVGP